MEKGEFLVTVLLHAVRSVIPPPPPPSFNVCQPCLPFYLTVLRNVRAQLTFTVSEEKTRENEFLESERKSELNSEEQEKREEKKRKKVCGRERERMCVRVWEREREIIKSLLVQWE